MLGSVFSPYYAWSRGKAKTDPLEHCALNVALYGPRSKRWALTERGGSAVRRTTTSLAIGPSSVEWDGEALLIRIDELTFPLPTRLRGVVRLHPASWAADSFSLDREGRHRWSPLAPCARVDVEFTRPALRWSGRGYLDSNNGDAPLEEAFVRWNWSRTSDADETLVLYDVARRGGDALSLAQRFSASGQSAAFEPPPRAQLPSTGWLIRRETRVDAGCSASVERTLEDTPFYARSLIATQLMGRRTTAMHESLSLDRFRTRWVKCLLPFRMPRRRGGLR